MKKKTSDYGATGEMNLKLVIGLSRTEDQLTRLTQQTLAPFGLTLSQFGVLEALYHLGDLKICQIIEKTLSSSGNMTVVINNLERDGSVKRYPSCEDGRVSMITLTDQGRHLIAQVFPIHVATLESQFSRLNDSEKQQLLNLLKKMNDK